MDDASTDASMTVLQEYVSDPRVTLLINEENSGSPFKQWNKGLDEVSGEYIWIAESDDWADNDFLQSLVEALDQNPNAGLAYCQSWLVACDPKKNEPVLIESMNEMFPSNQRWQHNHVNTGLAELANYLAYRNTIPNASAVLFRKSVVGNELRAREDMRLAGDWMFWACILLKSDLVFVAKPLNYFRAAHSGSQRNRTQQQALELIEGLDVYSFIKKTVSLNKRSQKKIAHYQVKLWGVLACLRRLSWKTNRQIYNKLVEVHPDIRSSVLTSILLPFSIYFVTAPLRHVAFFMTGFKYVRRASRLRRK